MPLRALITGPWSHIQGNLFPWLQPEVGPLTDNHKRLITVLELVRIEAFVRKHDGVPGRPLEDRQALARAFIAKAVIELPTSRSRIERLHADTTLRRRRLAVGDGVDEHGSTRIALSAAGCMRATSTRGCTKDSRSPVPPGLSGRRQRKVRAGVASSAVATWTADDGHVAQSALRRFAGAWWSRRINCPRIACAR